MREAGNSHRIIVGNPEGKSYLVDLDIEVRMILRLACTIKK
jgi:hypothetical protein